ncbi:class I adenylate-forming enzyme family protein [Saccharopolyspora spinosa]|uniref:Crotonobetaine/carnitine-CoA ligase n=1 Tax=Saccharopolyspora spinosa TaxID=60894 RepID=A0A2N3Y0D9_SACSN|nr:class I adenylate-forming enzyme family protein [Saccharopolyspora spinosa]PKW16384.1 crotonobetaine/carnitine-CoA ligase [Saccharopolyspora spinosa]
MTDFHDDSDVSTGRTLWSLATGWAARRGDEDVLVSLPQSGTPEGMRSMPWARFVDDVAQLRRALAAAGVADQRTVVLALPNSPLAVAIWLAVPANGAVIQVVDPDGGILAFERAVAATRPVLVVAARENAATMREAISRIQVPTRLVVPTELGVDALRHEIDGLPPSSAAAPDATPDLVAGLLPTSGTSGAPKLVKLTHRNYVMAAERLARNTGFLTSDRHYLCSPFFHTNGQLYLCAPAFVTGGSVAIVPRFSASGYFDAARWTGATVSSMVAPPMRMALHRALERGGAVDPGGLRLVQYGMNLSENDWRAWDALLPGIDTRQIYGQTESVTGVLGGAPWEADDRRTIGRPFVGVERVRLVGDSGAEVPDGEPGELWIQGTPGRSLMLGYDNAPEATAETLVADGDRAWLRTGDLMVRHPDGRFEFRGRRMHIIRRGGENLSTYGLELDLQSCPLVGDVAVSAQEDDTLDAIVVAHVIPAEGYDEAAFRAWCVENLGKRGVPDVVRVHESFPRTGSGRVIVRELG